ncbi:GerMN domain-containing protein [Glycomyces sp. NRRL B-16210]|uniref:GerMN domain-containing protein n=1 Tax=Glycomyces sp. NRRL B-16210 TaxID=1463821 RepID=UPI0004BF4A7F|nr:GerMN domain-containing protein [Glycomyces sp. NRRL B-16210]
MRRIWSAAFALLLAGCGVQPSEVTDGGTAPTGVAPGVTLYFVDEQGALVPSERDTGRLGTIADALALLLTGPGDSDLRTEIPSGDVTRVTVTVGEDVVELRVPLAADEVTPLGTDQIVCTALAAHVQAGGSAEVKARVHFTLPEPDSDALRTCPLTE